MNRREHLKSLGVITAGVSVFPFRGYSISNAVNPEKETVTLAYRLHPELWTRPFGEIRSGLLQYDEAINEIALFDESLNSRTMMPLNAVRERAKIAEQRFREFKEAGIPKAGINTDITIGFMTVGYDLSTYAYDFPTWMETMEAVKARPGHGYYHEDQPRLIVNKIFDVARQVRDFPAVTTDIQYELEDWTYTTLNKSVQTELNESLLSLMAGCTGIAYNAIYANEWEEKIRMFNGIAAQKPLWEKVKAKVTGLPLRGFWPVDHPKLMARLDVDQNGWFQEDYDIQAPNELAEVGIPFSNSFENSCGVLLSGRIAEAFSNEELKKMLSGAVYMDTAALNVLWERGLGEYTGVKHVNDSVIAVEIFSDHEINKGLEGTMRRAEGWSQGTYLEIIDDEVKVINNLHVMTSQVLKGPCLTIYKNDLGGRIAVSGYHPWQNVGMLKKVTQLNRLMNYLSKEKMPVIIGKSYRVLPLIRTSGDGKQFVLSLFNNSFDEITDLPVQVKSEATEVVWLNPDSNTKMQSGKTNDGLNFTVTRIEPWSIVVLTGK